MKVRITILLLLFGVCAQSQGVKGQLLEVTSIDSLRQKRLPGKELSLGLGVGSFFLKTLPLNMADDRFSVFLFDFNVRQMVTTRFALHIEYFRYLKWSEDNNKKWFASYKHKVNAVKVKGLFNSRTMSKSNRFWEYGLSAFYNHSLIHKEFEANDLLGGKYTWEEKFKNNITGVAINLSRNRRIGRILTKWEVEVGKANFDKEVSYVSFIPGVGLSSRLYINFDFEVYIPLHTFKKSN